MEQLESAYRNTETLIAILSAYDRREVKRAVVQWARVYAAQKVHVRKRPFWIPLEEGETVEGREWMEHNGVIFILNPEIKDSHYTKLAMERMEVQSKMDKYYEEQKETRNSNETTRQDLTPTITMLKCPVCDGGIIKEPICRGCVIGKLGFVYRYICQNDTDHIMYSMNKEGLDRELEEEMAKIEGAK